MDKYIFELPIKVRDYEIDAQGIVNNANYIHYLEHTRHEFCEYVGLTWDEMNRRGWMPVVRRNDVKYLHSLRSGDTAVSKLWMERRGPRFIFHQDIFNQDGVQAVKAEVTVVSVIDGQPSRGDAMAEAFADYISK